MNVQNVYTALEAEDMNSALGIICTELERQGYVVRINDKLVSSQEFFEGSHEDLEQEFLPIKVSLYREENFEQAFVIEFTEYHDFVIKKYKPNPRLS